MNLSEIILIKYLINIPRMMNFVHFGDANATEFSFINNEVRKSGWPTVHNFDLSNWGVVEGMHKRIFGEESGVEECEWFGRAHS